MLVFCASRKACERVRVIARCYERYYREQPMTPELEMAEGQGEALATLNDNNGGWVAMSSMTIFSLNPCCLGSPSTMLDSPLPRRAVWRRAFVQVT